MRLAAVVLVLQGLFIPLAAVGNSEGWHTPVAVLSTGFPLGGVAGVLAFHRQLGPNGVLVGIAAASAVQVGLLTWVLARHGLVPTWVPAGSSRTAFRRLARTCTRSPWGSSC